MAVTSNSKEELQVLMYHTLYMAISLSCFRYQLTLWTWWPTRFDDSDVLLVATCVWSSKLYQTQTGSFKPVALQTFFSDRISHCDHFFVTLPVSLMHVALLHFL